MALAEARGMKRTPPLLLALCLASACGVGSESGG